MPTAETVLHYLVLLEREGDVEDDGALCLQQLILSPDNNTE